MSEEKSFSLTLTLLEGFVFKVDFGEFGDILTDEPPPLGQGEGPNPSGLLGAAVANCLCASLLFALKKKKQAPDDIRARVKGSLGRVDGFWRITHIGVAIELGSQNIPDDILQQAVQVFEDYCVVTQSIRQGIPVEVSVVNEQGGQLLLSR